MASLGEPEDNIPMAPGPEDVEFERQITEVMNATEEKVSRTLVSIDDALTEWNRTKTKPPAFKKKAEQLKKWQAALLRWQRTAAATKEKGIETKMVLLRSIKDVCSELGGNA
ncbi:MAG: hypothetical protein V1492_02825 [Candidatus Micrarchaeota archaeon]